MRPDPKGARSPAPKSPAKKAYDRHSRTGTRGLPKKNGAGGKGTWGSVMIEDGPAAFDEYDINYDDGDDFVLVGGSVGTEGST
mmetsp:Transcript_2369/g.3483  ORF Transcript_2369/g.3483 Transcript_2369/m.3483 type:complete len:83 (-) Transcript_2369:541-789(-)|eukprot:CAMPEP_0113953814 /NCGR_PEP_ID=MMETSP0011_2-20120614/60_1 /TAXON_ID=101924 /ORGANISM="Rhodosorus marinus" /LENGTH=82 /DNA_ID=CAMNT_0000962581 /DNA_START=268 /DNA_END=516 /DNA_ORIENTATION=- /assembly_acc=CAM_ASM_000156